MCANNAEEAQGAQFSNTNPRQRALVVISQQKVSQ